VILPRKGFDGQFEANLTKLGLVDLGKFGGSGSELHPELFIAEEAQVLARWPNVLANGSFQWAYTQDCVHTFPKNCSNSSAFTWRENDTRVGAPPALEHAWNKELDPWLHG
jgi:hypothetical protein